MTTRVVFDSNIYLYAIIFGGNPKACLEMARKNEVQLFVSKAILLEIARKLKEKFRWKISDVEDVIVGISKIARVMDPPKKITLIKADVSDNRVLEVAEESDAIFIVSGDKRHLLSLKKYGKTKIISASDFLKEYF